MVQRITIPKRHAPTEIARPTQHSAVDDDDAGHVGGDGRQLRIARANVRRVVEDCAQAHGATYRGRPVGSLGDCAAWSFCQDRIMSTGGEGGMLTTNNREIWERVWSYKDHGRDYASVYEREHAPGFRWYIESFGRKS